MSNLHEPRIYQNDTHKSANADSDADPTPVQRDVVADHGLDLDALACGLIRLGVPAARSTKIIGAAVEALPCDQLTEANVLRSAIASI